MRSWIYDSTQHYSGSLLPATDLKRTSTTQESANTTSIAPETEVTEFDDEVPGRISAQEETINLTAKPDHLMYEEESAKPMENPYDLSQALYPNNTTPYIDPAPTEAVIDVLLTQLPHSLTSMLMSAFALTGTLISVIILLFVVGRKTRMRARQSSLEAVGIPLLSIRPLGSPVPDQSLPQGPLPDAPDWMLRDLWVPREAGGDVPPKR